MEHLSAEIQKADADVAQLTDEIMAIDNQIAQFRKEMKAATEIRESEKADYQTTHTDYSESVDAVSRAVNVLKKQSYDRTQAMMFVQKVTALKHVPGSARKALVAFLQQPGGDPDPMSVSAPEANAYEFQSSGVVDMLEKLKDKFSDERTALEKEEMEKKHAYESMMQDLTDEVERATAENNRKKKTRSKLRVEELAAITKAVEILSSGTVSGAADKYLPSMVQTSFVLRGSSSTTSVLQQRVSAFLSERASTLHSRTLSLLATKVASDPFDKVKKMIKDLIVRLMEEANEEAEHNDWCNQELSTNKQTRDTKSEQVESLTSERDLLQADIAKLGEGMAELSHAIAEIDAAVAEATADRQAESAKNAETVKDAKEAQTAVAQAVAVLKEFYSKAAAATALAQVSQPVIDSPETFDKP